MKINGHLDIPDDTLKAFCEKWKVREFALYGSVLREDFRPDSDVDVLLTFDDDAPWDLWDIVHMGDDLEAIFGRRVDLSERTAIEASPNYITRRNILGSAQTIYVA